MTTPRKVAGLAALLGFVACIAWSSGLFRSACCSPYCDPCPILYSKSAPANSSPKVDIAGGTLPASFTLVSFPTPAWLTRPLAQIPSFLPHEFHRPMRN